LLSIKKFLKMVPMGLEAGMLLAHQKKHSALQRIQQVAAGTTAPSWRFFYPDLQGNRFHLNNPFSIQHLQRGISTNGSHATH
jgi:hypothetical protein